jgi:hypothetical protein
MSYLGSEFLIRPRYLTDKMGLMGLGGNVSYAEKIN